MIVIFIPIIAFIIGTALMLFLGVVFRKHSKKLILIYSVLVLLSLAWIGLKFWNFSQMNEQSISFTRASGNTVHFSFMPSASGPYALGLVFDNQKVNKKHDECEFFWSKKSKSKKDCINELIYRKIKVSVNQKKFVSKYKYRSYDGIFSYGGIGLKGTASHTPLNLYLFHATKGEIISGKVNIDASISELLAAKTRVIIGKNQSQIYFFLGYSLILSAFMLPLICYIVFFGLIMSFQKLRGKYLGG